MFNTKAFLKLKEDIARLDYDFDQDSAQKTKDLLNELKGSIQNNPSDHNRSQSPIASGNQCSGGLKLDLDDRRQLIQIFYSNILSLNINFKEHNPRLPGVLLATLSHLADGEMIQDDQTHPSNQASKSLDDKAPTNESPVDRRQTRSHGALFHWAVIIILYVVVYAILPLSTITPLCLTLGLDLAQTQD